MIKEILKENYFSICLAYMLITIECIVFSIIPYTIGLAIDDMIKGNKTMIIVHSSMMIFTLLIGMIRRMYDTRVFSNIYVKKAKKTILALRKSNLDHKKIVARYGLVGIYSDLFEFTIPNITKVLINISVSLIMLFFINLSILYFVIPSAVFVLLIQLYFSNFTKKKEYEMQETRENISSLLVEGKDCSDFLDKQKDILVKKSDIESFAWSISDFAAALMEIVCVIVVTQNNLTLGEITAALMYVMKIFENITSSFWLFNNFRILEMTNDLLKQE